MIPDRVRDELLAHANRIESGEYTWVPTAPSEAYQCCAVMWNPSTTESLKLSEDALLAICDYLKLDAYDPLNEKTDAGPVVGQWNDAHTEADVVRVLRAVANGETADDGNSAKGENDG